MWVCTWVWGGQIAIFRNPVFSKEKRTYKRWTLKETSHKGMYSRCEISVGVQITEITKKAKYRFHCYSSDSPVSSDCTEQSVVIALCDCSVQVLVQVIAKCEC